MSNKNNGGPAFPCIVSGDDTVHGYCRNGMTLRDYFAAQALSGLIASRHSNSLRFYPDDDAAYIYEIADAMLAARESQ